MFEFTLYVVPFVVSAVILLGLCGYAFRLREQVASARLFSLQTFAMAIWTVCYALELGSTTLEHKILWAKMKYFGSTTGPVLWFVFSVYYTNHRQWLTTPTKIALASFIVLTIAIVFTNEQHHWYWTKITLEPGFPETLSEHGFFFWIYAACMYLLIFASVVIYFNYYRTIPIYFRRQSLLMVVGTFIPLGVRILEDFIGFDPFPKVDNVILLLLFSAILYTIALFRFSALKIVPIAHSQVVQNINSGILVLDVLGRVVEMNPFAKNLIGLNDDAFIGQSLESVWRARTKLNYSPNMEERHEEEISLERSDRTDFFIVQVAPIRDEKENLIGHVISLVDITEHKCAEMELERLARTDMLTGVINRRHFFELAEVEYRRFKRYGHPLAILLIDIDHFKGINDTHGHLAGDFILKSVSVMCQQAVRTTDIFARYGGEEFICLLYEISQEKALETAERLRRVIGNARLEFESRSIPVTTSIGLAFAQADQTFETVIHHADQALYQSKNNGRNRVTVWQAGRLVASQSD